MCRYFAQRACGGARAIDARATVLVSERTRGGMDALLEAPLRLLTGVSGSLMPTNATPSMSGLTA